MVPLIRFSVSQIEHVDRTQIIASQHHVASTRTLNAVEEFFFFKNNGDGCNAPNRAAFINPPAQLPPERNKITTTPCNFARRTLDQNRKRDPILLHPPAPDRQRGSGNGPQTHRRG
jgi:hypothetical protein